MEQFYCKNCGQCCHLRKDNVFDDAKDKDFVDLMFNEYGITYLAPIHNITINIWPEEKDLLIAEAKSRGMQINIAPKRGIYDTKLGNLIILDYFIDHDVCPFFDDKTKSCTVYSIRPLICRSYPLTSTNTLGSCFYRTPLGTYGKELDDAKLLVERLNLQKRILSNLIKSGSINPGRINKKIEEINMVELRS
jgi:Fe-S-cluster containining protein